MLLFYAKIISLLFFVLLGFIAGKYFDICQKSIGILIVYILTPIFSFGVMINNDIPYKLLGIIPIISIICLIIGIAGFYIGKSFFKDSRANLMSLTLSVPNSGYFGVPVVIILFGNQYLVHQILVAVGTGISVYTYGFYIMNRTSFSMKTCLVKVSRIPVLHATFLGFALQKMGVVVPEFFLPSFELTKGAYSVLGLMMIGIGIGKVGKISLDLKLISLCFFGKFIVYPLLTILVIALDKYTLNLMDEGLIKIFLLFSIMPLGINTINFAAITQKNEGEAATLVLLSSLISSIIIPIIILNV